MNKTVSSNIAGFFFNLEERAFQILNEYLETIKGYFHNADEREEIMKDIESRIAELFQEKLKDGKEVITLSDVDEVIKTMGEPEDFRTEEMEEEEEPVKAQSKGPTKQLFRYKENASIGGVCAGLGAYFGLDPILFRLLFVILGFTGSGVLIYIILLFVIPEAKTTADKLKMRGEPINVNNIKKQFHDIKNDLTNSENTNRIKDTVKNSVEKGVKASSGAFRVLGKIFGLACVIGGIFAIWLLISLLIGETGLLSMWGDRVTENLGSLMDILYETQFHSTITYYSIIWILFAPIIGFMYLGTKLLLDIKAKFKTFSVIMTVLWFVAVGICTITGVQLGMEFRENQQVALTVPLENPDTDIIHIDVLHDDIFSDHISYENFFRYSQLIQIEEDEFHMGTPLLKIVENKSDTLIEIELIKKSHGLTHREAIFKSENIRYTIQQDGNNINLAPYFSIDKEDKLRNQEVIVVVKVPEGKSIHFGENINRMPPLTNCEECIDINKYENSTWTMKESEFNCVGCESEKIYINH